MPAASRLFGTRFGTASVAADPTALRVPLHLVSRMTARALDVPSMARALGKLRRRFVCGAGRRRMQPVNIQLLIAAPSRDRCHSALDTFPTRYIPQIDSASGKREYHDTQSTARPFLCRIILQFEPRV